MRSPRQTSAIGIAALWRRRGLRRAAALMGMLGLMVEALLVATPQPAVAAPPAPPWGLVLCHAGSGAPAGKPGAAGKRAFCPICLALALGGSAIMPAGAALRVSPALPLPQATVAPARRDAGFGREAAQPRGPPAAA